MADSKITDLTTGDPAQSGDEIPINRAGADRKVTASSIAALASGGVTDGDKGDIVVSSSGTVWTYDGVVPVAKGGTGQTTEAEALGEMIQALTADATPDASADYVVTYDASADTGKKVLLENLGDRLTIAGAAKTFYVRTDGNDSNDGLTNNSGGAWLTVQGAFDNIHAYDWRTGVDGTVYDITIQFGAGTYVGASAHNTGYAPHFNSHITLVGDTTTPANVVLQVTGDVLILHSGVWNVRGFTLRSTSAGSGFAIGSGGHLDAGYIRFTGVPDNCLSITNKSSCRWIFGESFIVDTGGASSRGLVRVETACVVVLEDITIDILSSYPIPATGFHGFVYIYEQGILYLNGATINGSGFVTGRRAHMRNGGVLFAGDTWTIDTLPGTTDAYVDSSAHVGVGGSTVNALLVTDEHTGTAPTLQAIGTDTDVGIKFGVKGDPAFPMNDFEFNTGVGDRVFKIITPNNAAGGPTLSGYFNDTSPTAGDAVFSISGYGNDSVGVETQYGRIDAVIVDTTNGNEDGKWQFTTRVGGTLGQVQMSTHSGVVIGTSTVYPGQGNLRVTNIELGNDTDTTLTRAAAGALAVEGVRVAMCGKQTIWVPASAMTSRTTSGAEATTRETNGITASLLAFDTAADEGANFHVAFPKSWDAGTVTYQAFWTAASSTGTVEFELRGGCFANDAAINTSGLGTAVAVSDTLLATNDVHVTSESSAVTLSNAADDTLAFFEIIRDVSDDTLGADAELIGIKFFYTTDAGNDA